jgi:molybdate transport system regulatory protein
MEKSPPDQQRLIVDGKIWIELDDKFMGLGRVELLERIEFTGSINKAAQLMGMSYKKAWGLVQSMSEQSTVPLVLTQTGGVAGGGASITEGARRYVQVYKDLQVRFRDFL